MKKILLIALLFNVSCSSNQRTVASSDKENELLSSTFENGMQLKALENSLRVLPTVGNNNARKILLEEEILDLKSKFKENLGEINTSNELSRFNSTDLKWRTDYQIIRLRENYFKDENGNHKDLKFYYDQTETNDHSIKIYNYFDSLKQTKKVRERGKEKSYSHHLPIEAELSCDKEVYVKSGIFPYKLVTKKSVKIFREKTSLAKFISPAKFKMKIPTANTSCLLKWKVGKKDYVLSLKDERYNLVQENQYKNSFETCLLPKNDGIDEKINNLFFSDEFQGLSCAYPLDSYKILNKKIDGLQEKARALLGQELPEGMIKDFDPYYPLDFSKAPELSGIYISYLVWRWDFTGAVIERLIRHHAKKGVPVKIMISKVISLKKDKIMLEKLNADFPNVTVKLYKYNGNKNKNVKEVLGKLHRTNHIKVFIVKNANDKSKDMAILGGRNIHDGFMFDKTPDLKKHPHLVQYGKDESKAIWTDFEIRFNNHQFVKSIITQFYNSWNYDRKTYIFRNHSLNIKTNNIIESRLSENINKNGIIRHFISSPFSDNYKLEQLYVKIIDSASKTINLSTPYFNLTKKISKAFERAVDRGVKVDLITRLNLDGDIASKILSDVNKGQVNKFKDTVSLNEFKLPNNNLDILHSKLIVVDNKFIAIGSINFNQRSFFHDLENVALIWSPKLSGEINSLLDSYRSTSRPIVKKQKIGWLNKIIIHAFKREL